MSQFEMNQFGWEWGPFEIERTAHIPGRGWVLTVRDASGERVEITTSEKGRSGLKVRHVLFASKKEQARTRATRGSDPPLSDPVPGR